MSFLAPGFLLREIVSDLILGKALKLQRYTVSISVVLSTEVLLCVLCVQYFATRSVSYMPVRTARTDSYKLKM